MGTVIVGTIFEELLNVGTGNTVNKKIKDAFKDQDQASENFKEHSIAINLAETILTRTAIAPVELQEITLEMSAGLSTTSNTMTNAK